ncbi:NCS1 nucleoside transporter family protein [Purpureocillium lavendulum]|uniref:NCS1 nucleoside transporter family protein n=1 Tax=Purpureocillium lavendulum TaxID=1247861 RepID=A0AB34FN36_9HYPO|nr:NCS1 nucleoside transporter family protein [Purpureocillium lavendulum]
MGLKTLLKRIELQNVSALTNEDVRPCEAERRTWTFLDFHNFWLLINCNVATFLTGSALIPLGLTWWQAIISIVVGNIIATTALLLSSLAGAYYHIGFPVYSRAIWGIWGAQFTIWNRIFLSFVWYGFQAWVGGECVYMILLSWDPKYESRIPNTIPEDTGMTSAQFVAYVIFSVISLPFLWIRPHRLQPFFYVAATVTFIFFLVLLIWALATMGPSGFGSTLSSDRTIPLTGGPTSTAWLMVYGVMSTVGSIAAGILNQNDYARLAKRPRDAIWGQAIAYPLYCNYAAVLGILVVAATQHRFDGEAIWNPPTLFVRLLEKDPSSGTRAAVFFAGLALVVSQLGSSIPGNALAGGIDLASTFPKYINIRRGAYITALISPAVNPWRLVNTATIFLTVLSSYGIFLAPMTGMMTANYLIVCKRKFKVDDLYRGDKGSIYWYTWGVNWRAPVAWIVGVIPPLPGFISQVNTSVTVTDAAVELYYLNYLYGYLASLVVYSLLHWAFPAKSLDAFVREPTTAAELQQHYRDRWDSEAMEGVSPSTAEESSGKEVGRTVAAAI